MSIELQPPPLFQHRDSAAEFLTGWSNRAQVRFCYLDSGFRRPSMAQASFAARGQRVPWLTSRPSKQALPLLNPGYLLDIHCECG